MCLVVREFLHVDRGTDSLADRHMAKLYVSATFFVTKPRMQGNNNLIKECEHKLMKWQGISSLATPYECVEVHLETTLKCAEINFELPLNRYEYCCMEIHLK